VQAQKVHSHTSTLRTSPSREIAHRNPFRLCLVEKFPVHEERVKRLQQMFLDPMSRDLSEGTFVTVTSDACNRKISKSKTGHRSIFHPMGSVKIKLLDLHSVKG
jgi:hypothetical protein